VDADERGFLSHPSWPKPSALKSGLLLLLLGTIVGLLGAEVIIRWIMDGAIRTYSERMADPRFVINGKATPHIDRYRRGERYAFRLRSNYDEWHEDRIAGYRFHFRTNDEGFRQPVDLGEGVAKTGRKIMVIGDSLTFGHGSDYEGVWTTILERRLNRGSGAVSSRREAVHVFNFGVGAWGFAEYYLTASRYRPLVNPDLTIVALFPPNDFHDLRATMWEGRDEGRLPSRIERKDYYVDDDGHFHWGYAFRYPLLRESVAWILFSDRFMLAWLKSDVKHTDDVAFSLMKAIAEGGRTLVLMIPAREQCEGAEDVRKEAFQRRLERAGFGPIVDLYSVFSARDCRRLYFVKDPSHLTFEGNTLLADAVLQALSTYGISGRP